MRTIRRPLGRFCAILLPFALMAGCILTAAAENPAIGVWQCIFAVSGDEMPACTVTIKEEAGKLVGTLASWPDEFPLKNLKLEGDELSFEFSASGSPCTIKAKITGKKLLGTWSGDSSKGVFKGEKQP